MSPDDKAYIIVPVYGREHAHAARTSLVVDKSTPACTQAHIHLDLTLVFPLFNVSYMMQRNILSPLVLNGAAKKTKKNSNSSNKALTRRCFCSTCVELYGMEGREVGLSTWYRHRGRLGGQQDHAGAATTSTQQDNDDHPRTDDRIHTDDRIDTDDHINTDDRINTDMHIDMHVRPGLLSSSASLMTSISAVDVLRGVRVDEDFMMPSNNTEDGTGVTDGVTAGDNANVGRGLNLSIDQDAIHILVRRQNR